MTPLFGEGIEARGSTGGIVPAPPGRRYRELEEDSQSRVERAASLEEVDGEVQVDVVSSGELSRLERLVTGPLQLLGAPALDPLGFGLDLDIELSS
jgi:hypothetical protein